jgi:thioesterase domain-containing protein
MSETKRALLELLRAQRTERSAPTRPSNVIALRDAPSPPIVLIHPIGGGIFCYSALARAFPPDRAVWGVCADDLLSGQTTVEELAGHYLEQLRPAGVTPAALAGWSFGGLIAYEMARQWPDAAGPRTVLLDTMTWPKEVPAWDDAYTTKTFLSDLVRSSGAEIDETSLSTLDWTLPAAEVLARAAALLELPQLPERHQIYRNAVEAMRQYRAGPHAGPVLLMHAGESDTGTTEWRSRVGGGLTVRSIPGDHYAVIRPPAVQLVADYVANYLANYRGQEVAPWSP